jgi:hypothetical protein
MLIAVPVNPRASFGRVERAAADVVAYAGGGRIGALPLRIDVVPPAVRVLA